MTKIKDQVVWITGASSGIGEALALACAAEGARLVLSARSRETLEALAERTSLPRENILILPIDLSRQDNFPEAVAHVINTFGEIDLLINNAGISQRSLAIETDLSVDRQLMEVNYFGTVALTKAVLPRMIARKQGHIVVVSSLVGKFGTPKRSGYSASKHALHGYFDSLRAELWQQGITISLICPGFIRTQITYSALTGDGSPQGTMDAATDKGMDPDRFAQKMLNAIRRQKDEAYIGGPEIRGIYLKRFFPRLFNRIIRRARVV